MVALRLAGLLLWLVAGLAEARPVDVSQATSVGLGGNLYKLSDPQGELTVPEVDRRFRDGMFVPLSGALSAGYTDAVIWLAFELQNPSTSLVHRVLSVPPAHLDRVTLAWQAEGRWHSETLGDDQPWAPRALRDRLATFPLQVEPGTTQRYFLRIETEGNVAAVPAISTYADHFWQTQFGMFLYGGLLFAALVVALSNLLQAWLTRQRVYLLYALFVAVSAVYLLLVEAVIHVLWNPEAAFVAAPWVTLLHGGVMLTSHLFMREVIGLRHQVPLVDLLLWALALGALVAGCVSVLAGWDLYIKPWMWMAFLVQVVVGLSASGWLALGGHRGALQYFLAFAATAVGVVVSATAVLGLHDQAVEHNVGNAMTALIHMVLMQLVASASARRNQLTREQAEAIELETARRTRAELEQEVGIRTDALSRANETLQEEVARGQLLAARLEHARARLEEALAEQRQLTEEQKNFVRMVAHEFRTPLAVISSSAEMIEEASSATLDDLSRRSLQRQRRAVVRLKDLIERALSFEELNDSAWALRLESVAVDALLQAILNQLEPEAARGLIIAADLEPCRIEADLQLLEVLFGNLLDNAIKYSPDGGHIQLRARPDAGGVSVQVEDDGPGVPESERERIFQKFTRGPDTNAPGFGIGLYMVRRIAHLHGGRVMLTNRREGGACVSVWLPRQAMTSSAQAPGFRE